MKTTTLLLFLVMMVLWFWRITGHRARGLAAAAVLFAVSVFVPVDCGPCVPGPPRLVPVVYGLPLEAPGDGNAPKETDGADVVCGGCVPPGPFGAKWVLAF